MEIKGELKRNGLPSLFRNFANENFQGVLTIASPVGEKLITLTENEVTIYCDALNESSRIGNILVGRGLVTEEALEETVRDQRKLEPRPKLGEMLVKRGLVPEKAIGDARRFQIEEDVCDILSWKNATFNFAGSDSAREIHPEDFAPDQVHRLTIDPDTFFKSVTKLSEDWESIGDRLPTQYLCFKLSSKAAEAAVKLPPDTQRILRYLKEGRSVEGAVRQSCVGRIQVCAQVIDLLEKGLVLPASGADLRYMASEHRAQKRYHDALYIYRRLLESPDAKEERQYLENLIVEISDEIVRLKQSGEYGEEAIIVSHKGAKDRYLQTQRRRKILIVALMLVSLGGAAYMLLHDDRPQENFPLVYRDHMVRSDEFVARGKFNAAIRTLNELDDQIPDKESHAARNIRDKKARIPGMIYTYIENRIPVVESMAERGGAERQQALLELRELDEEYPQNPSTGKIKDLIAHYSPKKTDDPAHDPAQAYKPLASREELLDRTRKADVLKQQKKYMEALREYVAIAQNAPANGDLWTKANDSAREIKALEISLNEIIEKAELAFAEKRGEKALELIEPAIPRFGDFDGLSRAQSLKTSLLARKGQAQQVFKAAQELEAQNRILDALFRYEQVADGYPEFPISAEARTKAAALKTVAAELRRNLDAALSAVAAGDFKKARDYYIPLLQLNQQLLIDQHIEVPVHVASIPPGSTLRINGKEIGVTPRNVMVPAGEPFEIVVERNGFTPKRVAGDRIGARDLNVTLKLDLEPVYMEFTSAPLAMPTPLLAPPVWYDKRLIVLNASTLAAIEPPNKEPDWTLKDLYDPRAPLPENANFDDKNYWYPRLAPKLHKPGFLLLPLRNRDLLEVDLRTPGKPVKRSLFAKLPSKPPEITGEIYFEEHSKLAGRSLLIAAFADGHVRCYEDLDQREKVTERWSIPIDPQDGTRRQPPAAGLFGRKGLVWVLSMNGLLQAIDPIESRPVAREQFELMSSRSTFSTVPNDNLAAFVQRNGKVILYDLEARQIVWTLPPRQAMEESVGVTIDETGVYVTTRRNDNGELTKYPRIPAGTSATPSALWSVKLDGHVDIDMTSGKHLYLVTHFNKVYAYSKKDLAPLWDFKIKPEMGDPTSVRVFGDYVYVSTNKGKIIILKSE